ncbi:phage regulatory CII family protein [Undibacterium sp. MH2W]|uniref:phage regulatory CII family protein n=1 Tax=Undibacterium sp. MH2W TaxID=3413044 RepID=UPI003BF24191
MTTAADAFYRTCFDSPGGIESLAPRLNMSAQVLRNKANPNTATNHPTLNDVERVMDFTGDFQVLHALAGDRGFICIRVDADAKANASDMAVLDLITQVWKAEGDVGTAVNATLADGRVEAHEIACVRKAVYKAQEALYAMLHRLEGMQQ